MSCETNLEYSLNLKRENFRKKIVELLDAFESDTGLSITNIAVERLRYIISEGSGMKSEQKITTQLKISTTL